MRLFIIILCVCYVSVTHASTDLVFKSRVATTLSGASLYPDSTYEKQSRGSLKVGELLEVLGETELEYEDASQNQKFKWYKVRSLSGKEGWVYGDGLAVILSEDRVEEMLKPFHKKKRNFNNGFEKGVIWIAGLEGRDNFHKQDLLNPPYKEYYIVISNDRGNCVFINYSSENARGRMDLRYLTLEDTTGDEIPEILLQTSSFSNDNDFENRTFEIHSFQSGSLRRIFEERMSLAYQATIFAPSLFKYIEVDHQIIRVAYVDYVPCTNYKQSIEYDGYNKNKERCMEYVTYTYSWNERTKQYRAIYDESRTAPIVGSRKDILSIKQEPSIIGKNIANANRSERLEVIKHHERKVMINGVKQTTLYFYVKLADGTLGYIEANEVGFIDIEHATLLNEYYQSGKGEQADWKTKKHFLNIVGDNRSSYSGLREK